MWSRLKRRIAQVRQRQLSLPTKGLREHNNFTAEVVPRAGHVCGYTGLQDWKPGPIEEAG